MDVAAPMLIRVNCCAWKGETGESRKEENKKEGNKKGESWKGRENRAVKSKEKRGKIWKGRGSDGVDEGREPMHPTCIPHRPERN